MKAISLLIILVACATQPAEDPAKAIALPLLGKHPGIRECYTNTTYYVKNSEAEVLLKVEFEIAKNGSTSGHKMLASTLPDAKFQKCILDSLETLMYPPQKEEFIVEQSFSLSPRKK
jgi:hypothetical protein